MSEILTLTEEIENRGEDVTAATCASEAGTDEAAAVEERTVIFEEALEAILFAAGHPVSYATLVYIHF